MLIPRFVRRGVIRQILKFRVFHACRSLVRDRRNYVLSFQYHLYIELSIQFPRWSSPRTTPIVAGVYFLTAKTKIHSKPFRSKLPFSPVLTRPRGKFESQSYPLSINTRIAREICSNSELFFSPQSHTPHPLTPISPTDFHPEFVNNKTASQVVGLTP
ncbi:Uncharacterised protein [Salmonella enterica subsp. enterica serovar Typhimurium str. DT104]|nr:Uncharacterised protein [Salmonella enterica subsp. enterica serovar Typhimurium str. DT104]VFR99336.1 Uncharacterised protein [Salmonella enterica subsp. enterica serovar Typhimurium]CQB01711.1 Uncharacterised protein [Salmonella enterica subsp. enterica serovar Typhimurium str. DT104]CQC32517.1 Uncharacterised protein [Salmonella enterica subsp. enterica serovar Typhimurium str. DT104]CQF12651.1 Uncharacterised protein [Salmonella enterica subsp. enterica serovar Typhimurium str. DT104]